MLRCFYENRDKEKDVNGQIFPQTYQNRKPIPPLYFLDFEGNISLGKKYNCTIVQLLSLEGLSPVLQDTHVPFVRYDKRANECFPRLYNHCEYF